MKQTVGILLDHDMYTAIPNKRTGYEHIHLYNKAGKQIGVQPFYMSLRRINNSSALGFIYDGRRYRLMRRKIPEVTHNRTITLTPIWKKKLETLARSSIVFNRLNRFGKHKIYNLLLQNRSLRQYLPHTIRYSRQNLHKVMKIRDCPALFIKPTSGSVGNGIIKLSQHTSGKWNMHWKKGKPNTSTLKRTADFLDHYIGNQPYIIQEAIPLATFNGRPYDLRVSVQRGANGNWQLTGIVGKVAAAGRHVTNVAKGGSVKRCEELFEASGFQAEAVKEAVSQVSLEIARFLGNKLPHLADIGLDMGVDWNGNIKLIEMNGRDQRITFKKANLHDMFFQTYSTPLLYAKYLLNKRKAAKRPGAINVNP
jgi:hypothetical protein